MPAWMPANTDKGCMSSCYARHFACQHTGCWPWSQGRCVTGDTACQLTNACFTVSGLFARAVRQLSGTCLGDNCSCCCSVGGTETRALMQSKQASPKVYGDAKAARGCLPPAREGCPSSSKSSNAGEVRRSGRVRSSAHKEGPFVRFDDTLPLDQCLRALASDDDTDDADWPLLSSKYQATIPALRPRPAKPTRAEAKFLQAVQVYPPTQDTADDQLPDLSTDSTTWHSHEFLALYMATIPRDRAQLLEDTVHELDAKLGPRLVKVLGLSLLGSKHVATWKPHEELLFCLGMCDKYRMFKSMKRLFLKNRSVHELNGYYHNVWKTRSTPEADEYLALREQGAAEHEIRQFEEGIRKRLAAMWDTAVFGEQPVSSCGPPLYKQRLPKPTYIALLPPAAGSALPPAVGRPVGRPPKSSRASPSPSAARAAAVPGRSSPHLGAQIDTAGASATGQSSCTTATTCPAAAAAYGGAPGVDFSDPAVLAAMPAVPKAPIAPRPGAKVLSLSTGRLKLGAGVSFLGSASPQQQQQQQPLLMSPNGLARFFMSPAAAGAAAAATASSQAAAAAAYEQAGVHQSLSPLYQRNAVTWGSKFKKAKQAGRAAGTAAAAAEAANEAVTSAQQGPYATHEPATADQGSRPQPHHVVQAAAAAQVAAVAAQSACANAVLGDVTGIATGDIHAPSFLSLPEMPRMPSIALPDGTDPQEFQVWLKALGACRAAMTDYKQEIALRAGFVVQDAQQRMQQAAQQQHQALMCAETYLHERQNRSNVVVRQQQQLQQQEQELKQQSRQQHPEQQVQHADDLLADESLQEHDQLQQQQRAGVKVELLQGNAAVAPAQLPPKHPVPLDQLQSAVQLLLQRPSSRKLDRQGNTSSNSKARQITTSWSQSSSSQQQPQGGSYFGDSLTAAVGPQAKRQKLQPAVTGITAAVS